MSDVVLEVSWNDHLVCKHEKINKVCHIRSIIQKLILKYLIMRNLKLYFL